MNISSSCHDFDDLHILLARMNIKSNIIGMKETRFKKYTVGNININLNEYAIEPTEANCSGALLYIDNLLNYTVPNDLAIYKEKNLSPLL